LYLGKFENTSNVQLFVLRAFLDTFFGGGGNLEARRANPSLSRAPGRQIRAPGSNLEARRANPAKWGKLIPKSRSTIVESTNPNS
jgi:hypothetical protein